MEYAFAIDRANVPSLETVDPAIANVPVPNAASLPTYTAPAFKVAPPLNVLAPLRVNAPEPAFVSPNPPPEIAPDKITSLFVVSKVEAASAPEPLIVRTPLLVE
jgi:hypothetical protein